MLRDIATDKPSAPIFKQLDEGLRQFDQLATLKSRYIEAIPGLAQRIQRLKDEDRRYVAHELLNEEWKIFHFADVAADMACAKLSYVGSAHLLDHLDGLSLTAEQREFLMSIRNPIRRESLRGFEGKILRGVHRSIYQHVLKQLDSGPRTGAELLNDLEPDGGMAAFRQVMIFLVGQDHCHVVPPENNLAERIKRTEALNRAILSDARDWNFLASPVLGGGIAVDTITQLLMLSAREKCVDPVGFIWKALKSRGQKLVKEGRPLESEEENLAELRQRIDEIQNGRARLLASLEVNWPKRPTHGGVLAP